jgi:hypothetical protein
MQLWMAESGENNSGEEDMSDDDNICYLLKFDPDEITGHSVQTESECHCQVSSVRSEVTLGYYFVCAQICVIANSARIS